MSDSFYSKNLSETFVNKLTILTHYNHMHENKRRIHLKRASQDHLYDLKKEFKKQAVEIKQIQELNEAVIARIKIENM